MAVRAGSPGLEMGRIGRVIHEGHGGFLRGPLDDDAQCGVFAFTFEAFMAGSPGEILPPVLGDERAYGSDIVRDPVFASGCDG